MRVPCTPHIPAGRFALFDELPPTRRLAAWPNDCNNVDSDSHTGPAYLSDPKLKVHSNRYRDDLQ